MNGLWMDLSEESGSLWLCLPVGQIMTGYFPAVKELSKSSNESDLRFDGYVRLFLISVVFCFV